MAIFPRFGTDEGGKTNHHVNANEFYLVAELDGHTDSQTIQIKNNNNNEIYILRAMGENTSFPMAASF